MTWSCNALWLGPFMRCVVTIWYVSCPNFVNYGLRPVIKNNTFEVQSCKHASNFSYGMLFMQKWLKLAKHVAMWNIRCHTAVQNKNASLFIRHAKNFGWKSRKSQFCTYDPTVLCNMTHSISWLAFTWVTVHCNRRTGSGGNAMRGSILADWLFNFLVPLIFMVTLLQWLFK